LGTDPKKHACYDIDVEVDDPVRDSMRTFLSPQNTHELEELDGKVITISSEKIFFIRSMFFQILQYIDSINQLKQSREFYLSFADDPQGFICKWLASQSRDLKTMTDSSTGNAEEERRADYYTEQWSYEAVSRYFYNKVQQKRAELEQALGIRNP
jgi:SWI/SNF-related matrix-associated actin-dependent regulator of chromatin subfamily D